MPVTNSGGGVKAGTIVHFAGSVAPGGFLKANGAAVSRAAYAALFLAIGTTYGAGDGATTFNLPDLRGEFVRGLDDGRGVDPARALGSWQGGATQAHAHESVDTSVFATPFGKSVNSRLGGSYGGTYTGTTSLTSSEGGSETRPRNVAALACIKY